MLALAGANHRGQHLHPGALGVFLHRVHHLIHRLLADFLAAPGTVRNADACPEQAQVVVDFRHRAHGGAGVAAGGLLVDGDGGAQAVDHVHVGLLHLPQELPGVAGQAFHIPPLALGINGIEGQAALARAGQPGEHHQLVPWDGQVHVAQVMLPRPLNHDIFVHALASPLPREFLLQRASVLSVAFGRMAHTADYRRPRRDGAWTV